MSKKMLRNATYSVAKLFQKEDNLSYNTRSDYKKIAIKSLKELYELKIQLPSVHNLKQKHVKKLLHSWQQKSLSPATIKNKLSALRTVGRLIGKTKLVPKNQDLNLAPRSYINKNNLAINQLDTSRINNKYVHYSLHLQAAFGLRRQESIKFIVSQADQGTYINIKGSWTKGGVPRKIPITNHAQRALLDKLNQFCKKGQALIPKDKNYRQQLSTYISQTQKAGLKRLHGLRHAYAQRMYRELTDKLTYGKGWDSPMRGGLPYQALSSHQRIIDRKVRETISHHLGHQRISIVRQYIG